MLFLSSRKLLEYYSMVYKDASCAAAPHDTKRQYRVQHARIREARTRKTDRPNRSALLRTTVGGELREAVPGRGPFILGYRIPKKTGRIRKETA
jgi:hypothetical protein